MTFLVLAMLAVSSTGRSTSVQAVRPAKRLALAAVRVEPDAILDSPPAPPFQVSDLDSVGDCAVLGCGHAMAEAYLTSLRVERSEQAGLTAVRIVPAADANDAWRSVAVWGCLSYYDAEYDRIVYGEGEASKCHRTAELQQQQPKEIADDEVAELFYGLVNARGTPARGETVGKSRPIAEDGEWIDWSDYAELIVEAIGKRAVTVELAKTSESGGGVRSSDWLRHSAALSLHRVGALLQAVAVEVDQAQ
jgi:hypothetical protein